MDELHFSDDDAHRLARFFADLMATLAEGGVVGAESAEASSALWHATPTHVTRAGLDLDSATLVHGLSGVSAALVAELVAERRAAGSTGCCAAEVWREVAAALDAADGHEDNSTGMLDKA